MFSICFPSIVLVNPPKNCSSRDRRGPLSPCLTDLLFQKLRIIIHVQHTHVLSHLGEQGMAPLVDQGLVQGKTRRKKTCDFF